METASYKPKLQSRNGGSVHLLIHFIWRKPLNNNNMMPSLVAYFGIVNFGGELLEDNVSS
jgi:hypothetical protein